MWNDGARVVLIALAFPDRSREAVETLLSKMVSAGTLRARPRKWFHRTPRMDALFTKAVLGGIGIPALCDIFRRDETTVYEWKRSLGLTGTYLPPPATTTARPCLGGCGKMHDSKGVWDRVCETCKRSDVWRSGVDACLSGATIRAR